MHHPSSYRDPSGYMFEKDGVLYRQVNLSFRDSFDHFISSGCYDHFVGKGLLIPHETIPGLLTGDARGYATLKPQLIPFITYPWEWTFGMLKDAALLTLQLAREALHYEMMLKDATPYNVQWYRGRLIFIDTLSFERYSETPWIAYRQFCEQFLGPLLLMHYQKLPLQPLQLSWPDGIPLAVISRLLPKRTKFSLHTYLHIHLHARVSGRKGKKQATPHFSKQKLLTLLSSLESLVNKLRLDPQKSTWSEYYEEASGRANYLEDKKAIIAGWLDKIPGLKTGADLGANEGAFARLLSKREIETLAVDFDPFCIDALYKAIKKDNEKKLQPGILDLSNPSPAIGVNNEERMPFLQRVNVDIVLALALVHHLAIGKNIPFEKIADLFHRLGRILVIEFVPKTDEKVQLMLETKPDIYTDYTEDNFVSSFSTYFSIAERQEVEDTGRVLFLMKTKS
ncbi:MAG TPA: hypothetical protein VK644_00615 [Chitinophagaceae bacterium]|nr:hypothetical protein [Chitinophagaceae bacterium]